jgi:hypothetical protein
MAKSVTKYYSLLGFVIFVFLFAPKPLLAQGVYSETEKETIAQFEKQAKEYSKLREDLENLLPKLSKDATAEEIETHKINFQKSVQKARSGAKQGEIFTPKAMVLIRKIIKTDLDKGDRAEIKQINLEAETKGVPLKINFPYPEAKEQAEMSPVLLLSLPKLPKQLRYRFVGNNLLLVDRENGLIIDYMLNAMP